MTARDFARKGESSTSSHGEVTMGIGQLAKASDVQAVTIRYYEKQGLLAPMRRAPNGYREYGNAQLRRLTFIRRCRRLGFSLDDIRALLGLADQQALPCHQIDARIEAQLAEVRKRQRDLAVMEEELQRLTHCCAGGVMAQCHIVETLSEVEE